MDLDIFTEDMTIDEFEAKLFEVCNKSQEEQDEAVISFIKVLGKKIITSGEWVVVDENAAPSTEAKTEPLICVGCGKPIEPGQEVYREENAA